MGHQREHQLVESTVDGGDSPAQERTCYTNQSNPAHLDREEVILGATSGFTHLEETLAGEAVAKEPTRFNSLFIDSMEMLADRDRVAKYFDVHQEWFSRCSKPMQAESLGKNGYILTIGRFGAMGYEVSPKIGLELKPADRQGVYRIETIPVPDYLPPGYDVDFKATMELVELPAEGLNSVKTQVLWRLDLTVDMWFPKFIRALPQSLIQTTGDRLLAQIVRQVSRRLTHKVQTDFHKTHNLPMPKKK